MSEVVRSQYFSVTRPPPPLPLFVLVDVPPTADTFPTTTTLAACRQIAPPEPEPRPVVFELPPSAKIAPFTPIESLKIQTPPPPRPPFAPPPEPTVFDAHTSMSPTTSPAA